MFNIRPKHINDLQLIFFLLKAKLGSHGHEDNLPSHVYGTFDLLSKTFGSMCLQDIWTKVFARPSINGLKTFGLGCL
jgi:hypothetical protein